MSSLSSIASQWPAVEPLLDEALALPSAARAQWLEALPPDLQSLRPTLGRLLDLQTEIESSDFLATLPTIALEPGPQPGDRVGRYRLMRQIGEGGMGTVWLAERDDGQLRRSVALKLPRIGWASGFAERLARERDIVASLDHPNIASLYDAGFDAQGRPYLALEYVSGPSIDEFARTRNLDTPGRMRLLLQVAAAVAHAHGRSVIHRDLKPSNILVTDDGQVRLLDFGIAKLLSDEGAEQTQLTQRAGRPLTLDYASPEQVRGEPLGTASDVYGLSAVAYELLAGVKAFSFGLRHAAALEAAILDTDPPLASRAAPEPSRGRALRGDIDAILNKGLKKNPAQRYVSVQAWADDVQAALEGRPVQARPDTLAYRLSRRLWRHRRAAALAVAMVAALGLAVGVGATTLIIATLAAGLGLALWQATLAQRGRLAAEAASEAAARATARAESAAESEKAAAAVAVREAARAQAVSDFMARVFRHNAAEQRDAEAARNRTARELLLQGVDEAHALKEANPQAHAKLLLTFGHLLQGLRMYQQATDVFERAFEGARQAFGDDHVETHTARLGLGGVLLGSERGPQARRLVTEAVDGLRRLAPESWLLAEALSLQASVQAQRDPPAGVAAGRAAVALIGRLPPSETGVEEGLAHQRLGRALLYADDPDAAVLEHQIAARLFEARFGTANTYVLQSHQEQAHACAAAGRWDEARERWQALLAQLASIEPFNAEEATEAHVGLARAAHNLGEFAVAADLLASARALLGDVAGIRIADLRGLQIAMEEADLALATGAVRGSLDLAGATLARTPPDVAGLQIGLRMLLARGHLEQGDAAPAQEHIAAALPLLGERRGAGFMRLEVYAVAAACAAARGEAAPARTLLTQAAGAIEARSAAAPRRALLLALAEARVAALLDEAGTLQRLSNAWLPKLATPVRTVPRRHQAELALLLCAATPGHPEAPPALNVTLAWLRVSQRHGSNRLREAEALARRLAPV